MYNGVSRTFKMWKLLQVPTNKHTILTLDKQLCVHAVPFFYNASSFIDSLNIQEEERSYSL